MKAVLKMQCRYCACKTRDFIEDKIDLVKCHRNNVVGKLLYIKCKRQG